MKFPEKVSRESFTKFHKVSPSFNKRGKIIKKGLYLSSVNFQGTLDPKLVLQTKFSESLIPEIREDDC